MSKFYDPIETLKFIQKKIKQEIKRPTTAIESKENKVLLEKALDLIERYVARLGTS